MGLFSRKFSYISGSQQAWDQAKRDFFKSVAKDDVKRVRDIVAVYPEAINEWHEGKSVTSRTQQNRTAIFHAIEKNSINVFTFLLDVGATFQQEHYDSDKFDALEYAATRDGLEKKDEFVFVLLQRGARWKDDWAKDNSRLIDYFSRADKIRDEYLLQQQFMPASLANGIEHTRFFTAVAAEDTQAMSAMLSRDPIAATWRNAKKETAAEFCLRHDKLKSFKCLIDMGVIDLQKTLLLAVDEGKLLFVHALVEAGSNISADHVFIVDDGFGPVRSMNMLDYARLRGQTDIAHYIEHMNNRHPQGITAAPKAIVPVSVRFNGTTVRGSIGERLAATEEKLEQALARIDMLEQKLAEQQSRSRLDKPAPQAEM